VQTRPATASLATTKPCVGRLFRLNRVMSNDQTTIAVTTALTAAAAAVLLAIIVAFVLH